MLSEQGLVGLCRGLCAHPALHQHALRRDLPGGSGARQEEAVGRARHPRGAQQGLPGDALRHLHRLRLAPGTFLLQKTKATTTFKTVVHLQ